MAIGGDRPTFRLLEPELDAGPPRGEIPRLLEPELSRREEVER